MTEASRRNNFNLIRLLLASTVLVSHGFELIDGNRNREILYSLFGSMTFAQIAVDGFFLVSGYLISASYISNSNVKHFLERRVSRIYPGFTVCCLVCLMIIGPIAGGNALYLKQLNILEIAKRLVTLGPIASPSVFPSYPYPDLNSSLWTIRWEFMCYIMVLALGIMKLLTRKYATLFIFSVTFFSFLFLAQRQHNDNIYTMFRFITFYIAGICYRLFDEIIPVKGLFVILAIIMCILVLNCGPFAEALIVLPLTYLLISFGKMNFKFTGPLNTFPDISYGTYLYGWPIQKILIVNAGLNSPYVVIPLSIVCSMVAGFISWHIVEKHFKGPQRKTAPAQNSQT